jgi:hypothetical protein
MFGSRNGNKVHHVGSPRFELQVIVFNRTGQNVHGTGQKPNLEENAHWLLSLATPNSFIPRFLSFHRLC